MSPAKISRLETGQVAPKLRDVRDLLNLYEAPADERELLMQWADEARDQGWWRPLTAPTPADLDMYISLEAEAARVKTFSNLVPGLLQTRDYARAVLEAALPESRPDEIEQLVDLRRRRQQVLDREPGGDVPALELHTIIDEAALYRGRRNTQLMIDQLHHLLEAAQRPNVTLQVFEIEQFGPAPSPFAIFEPRLVDDGIVVNVEGTGHDNYYAAKSEIAPYLAIWDDLESRALGAEHTRGVIEKALVAREGSLAD